ncbi:MAG: iron-containing alcohol dehydrogenase [Spirochaetales bacterium]|nr:iron-containing alcohol dehydrogenase [Spirochaetales bacterium]
MDEIQIYIPSRIFLGDETLARLGGIAENYGSRALLVADSIFTDTSLPERIGTILERKGIKLINSPGIKTGAFHDVVEELVSLSRASKTQMIIGLGGIRTLSIAKCASALVHGNRLVDDLLDGYPVTGQRISYIEIPTTCRNPFMLNSRLLLLDSRNRRNRILDIPELIPNAVIIDSSLASTLSSKYALSTLMDTFLYALEGYLSIRNNFFSESQFLKSFALVDSALSIYGNPEYEKEFLVKASEAGLSAAMGLSTSGMGAGSGIAFAVAGKFAVPKSLTAAMMIPAMLEFGATTVPDKMARIASILEADTRGMEIAEAAYKAVEIMRNRLGVHIGELRLAKLKIHKDEITDIAEFVSDSPLIKNMPGAMTVTDIQDMIRRSL